jgi:hypothetical protein
LNAAFMSFQPHEGGIQALRSGAGEAKVTKARFRVHGAADGEARADHDHHKLARKNVMDGAAVTDALFRARGL